MLGHLRSCLCLLVFSAALLAGNRILVIESYHQAFAWDASFEKGLSQELSEHILTYFYMDTKRLPKGEHQAMADKAWKRYRELKPDLVILADDAALKFLGPRFAGTKTPVVFLGVNNNPRNYFAKEPENIVGIVERPLMKRSISYIKEIMPELKNLLVLFDSDLTSQIVEKEVFEDKDLVQVSGIQVQFKSIGTYKEWQDTILSSKGKYDAVVLGLYQTLRNERGQVMDPEIVVRWTSQNTPIPPFAFWDFTVGHDKAIGGLVCFGEDQGRAAGKMAKQLLSGTPIQKLPSFIGDSGELIFSRKQLSKYRLTLPAAIQGEARMVE